MVTVNRSFLSILKRNIIFYCSITEIKDMRMNFNGIENRSQCIISVSDFVGEKRGKSQGHRWGVLISGAAVEYVYGSMRITRYRPDKHGTKTG